MIDCCEHCVAPKRHIGCHGTCPEYIKQAAKTRAENHARYAYNHPEVDLYISERINKHKAKKLKAQLDGKNRY